jgi:alkyl hydroperoxide reductase subunit AhpC
MSLLRKPAPDFTAPAVVGNEFVDYKLSTNWTSSEPKYTLLFFYPGDFTFVCPTEIVGFSDRLEEFEARNVQVVGVSVDSKDAHLAWKKMPRSEGGIGDIRYPLVSDLKKEISAAYDVQTPVGTAFRGTFLIDQKGIVRACVMNDTPIGRSIDEALRTIDALQHVEQHGEVCPVDWKPGARALVAHPEKSKAYFAEVHGKPKVVVKAKQA